MENINSCLILACALHTPVSLFSIFDDEDLMDYGVEVESHITLLYASGVKIPRENILNDIETIIGDNDDSSFMDMISSEDQSYLRVLDLFDIGSFENDSDYIVLKLKKDLDLFKELSLINKSLKNKYNVSNEYNYSPHLTLAKLYPGTAKKYLNSEKLKLVLRDSKIAFEDFILSYGPTGVSEDRERYNLTTFHAVDRFFREESLRKEKLEEV